MTESDPLDLAARLAVRTALYAVVAALALLVVAPASWARGLALGGVASAANMLIMGWWLPRSVGLGRGKAEGMSFFSISLRYVIMGGAMAAALAWPERFFWPATAAGLLAAQITIFIERRPGGVIPARVGEGV